MKALLVHPDPLVLKTLKMILEMDGFHVECLQEGRQALKLFTESEETQNPFHLLVLDLELSGLSSLSFLKQLEHLGSRLPLILVMGNASKSTMVELLRLMVFDYLEKPFQMAEFRERIKRIVQRIQKQNISTQSL